MSRWHDSLVGWKIGYISADRRTAGDPDRLVGPIWGQQYHVGEQHVPAVEVGIFSSGFAAVEAEARRSARAGSTRTRKGRLDGRRGGWPGQHLLVGIEVASSPIPDINAPRPHSDRRRLR